MKAWPSVASILGVQPAVFVAWETAMLLAVAAVDTRWCWPALWSANSRLALFSEPHQMAGPFANVKRDLRVLCGD